MSRPTPTAPAPAPAAARAALALEPLEDRRLMAAPWNKWTLALGIDQVYEQFPWLNGNGHGVAVIDRGINYFHPNLGGNAAQDKPSPRIVNVYDYQDDDADPYPETDPDKDEEKLAGHGTGVAGILVAPSYEYGEPNRSVVRQQGMIQSSLLYNLRQVTNVNNQNSLRDAMQWVVENHAKYNITAVNLTDFYGTPAAVPTYDEQAKKLWDAGVFVATPVGNSFLGEPAKDIPPRTPIGFPGKSPWIFGTGGVNDNGLHPKSQRGPGLDLLGPAINVSTLYYNPNEPDARTSFASGNSWGTPMTVGVAVWLQQIDPTITPAEIMDILQDSGDLYPDPDKVTNPDGDIEYPRLNALEAVKLAYVRRDDAADRSGGNDTRGKAEAIAIKNGKGSATGLKLLMHDHDFYSFTANGNAKYDVRVNYSGTSAHPGGQLLDANGNHVANIGAGGVVGRQLAAGTYYVHLYNPNAALRGTYAVDITASRVQTPTPTPTATPGKDGSFNGIGVDGSNRLHFAWFDESSDTLKYASRAANGNWSGVTTVDGASGAGKFVSLKLDKNGRPGVAYYASTTADLKYAHFNGSSWDVETVSSKNVTGSYPSLAYNGANRAVISYYHGTGGDLRLASETKSGGWAIAAIDTGGDVGRYSSLALNPATGRWAVAYEATGTGAFKYASQNKNGSWSTTTVDTPGLAGGYVSLAFDANKNPAFSYFNAKAADLRLARFADGKWGVRTVASKGNVGLYTNLFFDGNDPVIYYYNKGGDKLSVARGGVKNAFSLTAIQSAGGRHNHVALDKDGDEVLVFQDSGTGDLKFV